MAYKKRALSMAQLDAGLAAGTAYRAMKEERKRLEAEAKERVELALAPFKAEWKQAAKAGEESGLRVSELCRATGTTNRATILEALAPEEEEEPW